MLQEVSVVARQLDDQAVGAEPEPLRDHRDVVPRVLDPAIGVGREIGVFGEDLLGRDVLLELSQEASVADVDVQRIERLGAIQLARSSRSSRRAVTSPGRPGETQAGVAEATARCRIGASWQPGWVDDRPRPVVAGN